MSASPDGRARSPMVRMPSSASRCSVLGPTPWSLRTGSGQTRAGMSASEIAVSPSGFCMSEASLASSLFGPMPMEQVSPAASLMRCLIARATGPGGARADGGGGAAAAGVGTAAPADDEGLAAQLGTALQLHRREEGVHVDVQDAAHGKSAAEGAEKSEWTGFTGFTGL